MVLEVIGCDPWTGPSSRLKLKVLHPLPCPWNVCAVCFPSARNCPMTQPWDSKVLRPSGWYMWLKASIIHLKILAGRCRDLLIWWPPKTSLVSNVPLLINTVTCQTGVLYPLRMGPSWELTNGVQENDLWIDRQYG